MTTLTPKGYCEWEDTARFLGIEATGNEELQEKINTAIAQAEAIIEAETGKVFIADETASERVFSGTGKRTLLIDDFVEVTVVKIDDEVQDIGTFINYPFNKTHKRGLTRKEEYCVIPAGIGNVKVTAKWGFSLQVPYDVVTACITLSGGIFNASEGNMGADEEIVSEKIGDYSVTYNKTGQDTALYLAKKVLGRYKTIYV